jgi:hypothetical protein
MSDTQIIDYTNIENFIEKNHSLLKHTELKNHLFIGVSNSIDPHQKDALAFTIIHEKKLAGFAIRSNPSKPIVLTEMDKDPIIHFVTHLLAMRLDLVGVNGPESSATRFASSWSIRHKVPYLLKSNFGSYTVNKSTSPHFTLESDFSFHFATKSDINFISQSIYEYDNELKVFRYPSIEEAEDEANLMINKKQIYLLKNSQNQNVSILTSTRKTESTKAISLVYTPPQFRAKGYGKKLIQSFCLYCYQENINNITALINLSDPMATTVFKSLNFEKMGETKHYVFV